MGRICVLLCVFVVFIVERGYCRPDESEPYKRAFEVPCKLDSDCCRNAFCDRSNLKTGGFCTCLDHYILQTNKTDMDCLPTPSEFGDSCEKDVQCQVSFGTFAECSYGTCKCNSSAHFENGMCYKSGKIGDRCNTNTDCYIEGALTFCVKSVCVCNTFYHPVDDGNRCVKSKILGETCGHDEECSVTNSRCHGECRCNMHYVSSLNRTLCLKASDHVNSSCVEDVQCTQLMNNAACVNGACGCEKTYHLRDDKCWKNVDLLGDCEDTNECIQTPELEDVLVCVAERCNCINGMNSNGTCVIPEEKNSGSKLTLQGIFIVLIFVGLMS